MRRPKAGGIQALERWRFPATEAGPRGSQERRGETHTEERRPTDHGRDRSWELGGEGPERSWERHGPGGW